MTRRVVFNPTKATKETAAVRKNKVASDVTVYRPAAGTLVEVKRIRARKRGRS